MNHAIRRPMLTGIALFISLVCLALVGTSVTASASPTSNVKADTGGATAQSARALTCAEATRVANFAERRVKKQRKKWRNGFISTAKYKHAVRIWKSWLRERNRLCSAASNPQALALGESEVRARVNSQAGAYCGPDPYCYDYGVYTSGGSLSCESKSTYTWSCYGWNDEYDGTYYTCAFREVVSRVGYNGITSYRDSSYGSGGFSCS